MLEPMDFKNMRGGKVNLEKGKELLERLSKTQLDNTFNLFKADGSIEGAFYLLYKGLASGGLLHNIQTEDGQTTEQLQMKLSILKYIMYNCFVIGAEAAKSVKTVEELWNLPETLEPMRKEDDE